MKYRICKMFEIENGHMLSKHPDKCRYPHGHSRKVELVVECESLDSHEMVFDFKVFKQAIGKFLDAYDHAMCMNTSDEAYPTFKKMFGSRVIGFGGMDPTTEIMAEVIFKELARTLALGDEGGEAPGELLYPVRKNVRVVKVRVWETSSTWAEYEE